MESSDDRETTFELLSGISQKRPQGIADEVTKVCGGRQAAQPGTDPMAELGVRKMIEPLNERATRLSAARWMVEVTAFAVAAWLVAQTAVVAKQTRLSPPMVAIDSVPNRSAVDRDAVSRLNTIAATTSPVFQPPVLDQEAATSALDLDAADEEIFTPEPGFVRYYDGRPLRAVRTLWMTVTAYSPDHRSCGKWADGKTATNTSVWTNGMSLVAADTRILPFGTLLTVPGYSSDEVVPVLDRGGAIKGHRLDVLYPTHEIALKWGVRRIPVTVWEYADGKGASGR